MAAVLDHFPGDRKRSLDVINKSIANTKVITPSMNNGKENEKNMNDAQKRMKTLREQNRANVRLALISANLGNAKEQESLPSSVDENLPLNIGKSVFHETLLHNTQSVAKLNLDNSADSNINARQIQPRYKVLA